MVESHLEAIFGSTPQLSSTSAKANGNFSEGRVFMIMTPFIFFDRVVLRASENGVRARD